MEALFEVRIEAKTIVTMGVVPKTTLAAGNYRTAPGVITGADLTTGIPTKPTVVETDKSFFGAIGVEPTAVQCAVTVVALCVI